MLKPDFLKEGDLVRIISPSYAINQEEIAPALEQLKSWNLRIAIGISAFNKAGAFAGEESERLADLQEALDDPDTKAIFCTRGGYGMHQIVAKLDFSIFKQFPKWVIGFSDISLLHFAIQNVGISSIHGTMLRQMSLFPHLGEKLHKLLFTGQSELTWQDENCKPINITAPITGGNLTLISTSIGTRYQIDTKNKILFLEEVGESEYRIDRMLYHLSLAGKFDGVLAVLIGTSTSEKTEAPIFTKGLLEKIVPQLPIFYNLSIGHTELNECVAIDGIYNLISDGKALTLNFLP
jgi:muramoyltetrapeptide carboxypeptidase